MLLKDFFEKRIFTMVHVKNNICPIFQLNGQGIINFLFVSTEFVEKKQNLKFGQDRIVADVVALTPY